MRDEIEWWFSFKKKDGKYLGNSDTVMASSYASAHGKALKKLDDDEEIIQIREACAGCEK